MYNSPTTISGKFVIKEVQRTGAVFYKNLVVGDTIEISLTIKDSYDKKSKIRVKNLRTGEEILDTINKLSDWLTFYFRVEEVK